MARRLFAVASAASLFLFVVACAEESLRFPDTDFSFYWASNGRMISVDSFEDTPQGNAITVRQLSPMPADVPFHFRACAVEAGTEAPAAGIGTVVEVWLDQNDQPVGRHDGGHLAKPMTVSMLAQIPLNHVEWFLLLTALTPALWCLIRLRSRLTFRTRRESGHCVVRGYDLRASAGRCPECGRSIDAGTG